MDIRSPIVQAEHGGKQCYGSSNITENCNIIPCPGKTILNTPLVVLKHGFYCGLIVDTTLDGNFSCFQLIVNGANGRKVNVLKNVMEEH